MRIRAALIATLAMCTVLAGVNATPATAEPPAKAKQAKLLKVQPSPTPKGKIAVYVADVNTGETTFSGFEDPQPLAVASISGPYNPPRATDFILDPVSSPSAAYGFAGVGTKNGTWLNRIGARSGNWYGYFYWNSTGGRFKSVNMQPHAAVRLTGSATVDQVTITQ
ncbi:hypothetical protein ABEG17_12200 [Pedococcus sp. KACC 23699]|uniref:Uncharacterized protein n=1 Tax=Pedococcus sp. KACC 23699 TaxID=3149228 RepID=A0AAU7JPZ8_9MICO